MPSFSTAHEYAISKEATQNQVNKTGFIILHPEKGLFLGVDDKREPVFAGLADIAPQQPVPTFLHPAHATIFSYGDNSVLECSFLRVTTPNPDDQTVLAGDIIKDGEVQKAEIEGLHSVYGSKKSIFNIVALHMQRFPFFRNRAYQAPSVP